MRNDIFNPELERQNSLKRELSSVETELKYGSWNASREEFLSRRMVELKAEIEVSEANLIQSEKIKHPGLFKILNVPDLLEESRMKPNPKRLFGQLWFEGELCILFADTNQGKSILAVQIADSITKGVAISPFELEVNAQPVLYFDFELSPKQFERRYSKDFSNHYSFSPQFYRGELSQERMPESFDNREEYIMYSIEKAILEENVKVLILDNLSCLKNGTDQAKEANPFIQELNRIKKEHQVSILVLGHTPKRIKGTPIESVHLQGSSTLMNLCDSAFAIGSSCFDSSIRYLKEIKQRNEEKRFDAENVCLFKLEKPDNFLQFTFQGYAPEYKLLSEQAGGKDQLIEACKRLSSEGFSQRAIASQLNISVGQVNSLLKG